MATAKSATANPRLIGLYGGTFDPVHVGHLHAASTVKRALDLTEVRLVLAARPGHRGAPAGEAAHRWQMLCLACAEQSGLVADDMELKRPGHSYTIDTVTAIRRQESDAVPCWILGQDAFATLPIWHRWQELLDVCNLVVIERPGDVRAEPPAVRQLCADHEVREFEPARIGQIYRLRAAMLEVSATQIRRKIAAGESVEDLLAPPVYTYIRQHSLYQNTENAI